MNETRTVADSMVETVHTVRPNHLNPAGRLFGGILMQWIDEAAGVVARRHARTTVTTVSVDRLHFIHGAYKGDIIVLIARLTYVGKTSMEVKIDSYTEGMDGLRKMINSAYVTMVALDEKEHPTKVPGLELKTMKERLEWEAGIRRREIRKMRKMEGF